MWNQTKVRPKGETKRGETAESLKRYEERAGQRVLIVEVDRSKQGGRVE